MTTKKKFLTAVLIAVAILSAVGYGMFVRNRGVVTVQTGRAIRQDLTQTVSANGEIKPKKYVNVSSNMMGRIVRLPVKEGDRVREGSLLVQLESIQSEADVRSAEASFDAAQTELEECLRLYVPLRPPSHPQRRKSPDPKPISLEPSKISAGPSR